MAHPQHPLNGRIVKVLGQETGYWLIETPDGRPEKLPLAWAEALPPIIAQANHAEPWAGVTELLNLVTMITRLKIQPPEEVDDDSQSGFDDPNQPSAGERRPGDEPCSAVGANSGAEAARTDPYFSGDAGQADSATADGGPA